MRNQTIDSPDVYLVYFQEHLVASGQLKSFPKLLEYYYGLADQFTTSYENHSVSFFPHAANY